VADAPDGAALSLREPRSFVPREQIQEIGGIEFVPRGKVGFVTQLRELVPWAE
jgi:hypothetical protein